MDSIDWPCLPRDTWIEVDFRNCNQADQANCIPWCVHHRTNHVVHIDDAMECPKSTHCNARYTGNLLLRQRIQIDMDIQVSLLVWLDQIDKITHYLTNSSICNSTLTSNLVLATFHIPVIGTKADYMTSFGGKKQPIGTVFMSQSAIGALKVFITCCWMWKSNHAFVWATKGNLC